MNLILKSTLVILAIVTLAGCADDDLLYTDANTTRVYNTGVAPAEVIHERGYYTTTQTPPAPPVTSRYRSYSTDSTPAAPAEEKKVETASAEPAPIASYSSSTTPVAPPQ